MSSNKGEGNFHDEHNRVLIPVGFEVGSVVGSGDGLTVGLSIGLTASAIQAIAAMLEKSELSCNPSFHHDPSHLSDRKERSDQFASDE